MLRRLSDYARFLYRCFVILFIGSWRFYAWMTFVTVLCLIGLNAYARQLVHGMYITGLSDQVSWGLYIGNFTFLVGMAASAVMVVIPVYIYKRQDLQDVVLIGELFAVASIIMCLMFVMVDLGRPDRFWHMLPIIGKFNWPISMLSWDVVVLGVYLLLNMHICGYLLYMRYLNRKPSKGFYIPFVFISIVWAVSIHTVTAFLLVGLGGRPFWNSAIIGARFITSAFASGLAFIILTLQIIRKVSRYSISDAAIRTLRTLLQVALIINIFLLGNELFKEFYSEAAYFTSARYLYLGLHGHSGLVPWIWSAMTLNILAAFIMVAPFSRKLKFLNLACGMVLIGIWIEKGLGLIVPGFIPTPLGEVVDYVPTVDEILICIGIWAAGLLLYTILLKAAIPILLGKLNIAKKHINDADAP